MSRWFRFYGEALNDPKVQNLPDALFKMWVNLLCIASQHGGQLPVIHELTYLLRRRCDRVERDLNELVKRGLIDCVDDHFEPHKWSERQYKSDASAERTRGWRNRKCDVTQTVTVTPPDTDTDTDTEKIKDSLSEKSSDAPKRKRLDYPQDFQEFWSGYPTDPLMSKKQALDAWKRLTPDDRAKARSAVAAFAEHCRKNPDYRPLHAVRFLTQRRYEGFAATSTAPPAEQAEFMRSKGYEWANGKWERVAA